MVKLNFIPTKHGAVLLIILSLVITYWRVPSIFFVQDEWLGLGLIIEQGFNIILRGLADEKVFHFIPIGNFLNFLSFHIFNLNYQFYNILGLLFHFFNGLLIYRLSAKIFREQHLAIIASIVFITSSIANQLLMWPVVSLNTISLSFALLAWIFLLEIKNNSNYFKLGIKIGCLVLLSILTVEYSIGLFVFIPLAAIIYIGDIKIRKLFIFLLPLLIICIVYFAIRVYPFISTNNVSDTRNSTTYNFTGEKMKLPIRYIGQIFIPQKIIESQASILSYQFNKPREDLFTLITIFQGGIALLFTIRLFLIKRFDIGISNWRRNMLVTLVFILSSSLPFLLIPGIAGNFALYPPRYLYFGVVGGVIIIVFLLTFMIKTNNKIVAYSAFLAILLYVSYNILGNWARSEDLYKTGQIRLGILNLIKEYYPSLSNKVVFYTESDSALYGLPDTERILPFQSGFGQTLLVWYSSKENWPKGFYKDKFLWEIESQGYKEVDNRGFGYFRDFNALVEAIEKNNLDINSVISFRYDSSTHQILENTEEIRGRLNGYFSPKKMLDLSSAVVISSLNSAEMKLTIDNNRNTYWDSTVPYGRPQSLDIDLKEIKEIAQIDIDSYNNKDQNKVGYAVFLSSDKIHWQEVFFAKVYPPKEDGTSRLYFKPEKAQYIRIEQRGDHEFASWVIYELKIYEKSN